MNSNFSVHKIYLHYQWLSILFNTIVITKRSMIGSLVVYKKSKILAHYLLISYEI